MANDLSGAALDAKKAEIIAAYPDIDSALFNADYWDAQQWHYTSLQTLLGDASTDWVKNKFSYLSPYNPEPEERPIICFSDSNKITSRGVNNLGFEGEFQIQVIADSSLDNAKAENVANRIIKVLEGNDQQGPRNIITPNNLYSLNWEFQGSSTGTNNFDNITLNYHYAAIFIYL